MKNRKKNRKKGTGCFFCEKEGCLYLRAVHIEKVACPLFLSSFFIPFFYQIEY